MSLGTVIFIFSHMRSGSTLLCHILNTNPGICGYGESRIRYRSENELLTLASRLGDFFGNDANMSRYIFDKLLHDEMLVDEGLLHSQKIRCIFLLRSPEEAIQSTIRLYAGLSWPMTPFQANEYFTDRLATMIKYATIVNEKNRCFLLTYHQLLYKTGNVFRALEDWLGLDAPLREDYVQHKATGVIGVGDPSSTIKMGRIVRPLKLEVSHGRASSLSETKSVYTHTLKQLRTLCLYLG